MHRHRPLKASSDQKGISSAADQKALNLAIRDEIAALEWVQCNIGAFGGDKDKVR